MEDERCLVPPENMACPLPSGIWMAERLGRIFFRNKIKKVLHKMNARCFKLLSSDGILMSLLLVSYNWIAPARRARFEYARFGEFTGKSVTFAIINMRIGLSYAR